MKKILVLLLLCFATACSSQTVQPAHASTASNIQVTKTDVLNTCVYKLDNSQLVYLSSKRQDEKSSIFQDYVISHITDVNGKRWNVNPAEWSNFVCTTKQVQ